MIVQKDKNKYPCVKTGNMIIVIGRSFITGQYEFPKSEYKLEQNFESFGSVHRILYIIQSMAKMLSAFA